MSSNENNSSDAYIDHLLDESRAIQYDTARLKESILAKTVDLPQQTGGGNETNVQGVSFRRRLMAMAACLAVLGIAANIMLTAGPERTSAVAPLSLEELEFEELMMTEDEFVFSQL